LRSGQASRAADHFRALSERSPSYAAWFFLGVSLHGLGRFAEAEQSFGRALEISPGAADAHCALGMAQEAQGRGGDACKAYDNALRHDASHFAARLNRGAAKLASDPLSALEDFDRLASAHASSVPVHANRTRALFALGRDDEALAAARHTLELDPASLRARLDEGLALAALGRLDESAHALAQLRKAAGPRLAALAGSEAAARRLEPRALRIASLLQQQAALNWRSRDALLAELRAALATQTGRAALAEPALVQHAVSLPLSAAEQRQLAQAALAGARAAGRRLDTVATPLPAPAPRPRIRIGFLAASLRSHPEAYLLRRLFLDRDRGRFEFFLYALNRSDGSAIRKELEGAADRFADLSAVASAQAVDRVRGDALDLLVDLSGAYEDARPELVAARLAPVQVAWLATPSTLGDGLHDYRLGDPGSTPADTQADWAERLVLLPHTFFAYDNGLRPVSTTRAAQGLDANAFVFCAMHQPAKLDPEAFDAWARCLLGHPRAVLWLLDAGRASNANAVREAQARGLRAEQLVFAPRVPLEMHLGRLALADLFLDTFHCGAHASAADALWAGLPVVTREGRTLASRVAASLLRASGLSDMVAASTADYESIVGTLVRDTRALSVVRARVAAARISSEVFDTPARVRDVEDAFAALVRR
jgi:protein O-GlcNAc transferase